MSLLGLDHELGHGWFAAHLFITLGAFVVIGFLLWRRFEDADQRWFAFTMVAASSIPVALLIRVGHYDVWFILGAAIAVLARTHWAAIIGGLLLGATNPEQAMVAIATLAAIAYVTDREGLRRAGVVFTSAVVAWIGVRGWYLAYGVEQEGRAGFLGENLRLSIDGFLRSLPIQVYSWFSAAWVAVVSAARSWVVLAALVTLPAVSAVGTVDGTRVFVACVMPALLFYILHVARTADAATLHRLTVWTLVIACFTPGISTWVDGMLMSPWDELMG